MGASAGWGTAPPQSRDDPCPVRVPPLAKPLVGARGERTSVGEGTMIPLDFSGKVALVTGVGDNESFAWFIAKALQAAGARVVLACHPRVVGIVEGILTREQ